MTISLNSFLPQLKTIAGQASTTLTSRGYSGNELRARAVLYAILTTASLEPDTAMKRVHLRAALVQVKEVTALTQTQTPEITQLLESDFSSKDTNARIIAIAKEVLG